MSPKLGKFLTLALASTLLTAQQTSLADRLARWKTVDMPFHAAGLTPAERQMVEKLVEANRLLNQVFWRQSDADGLALLLKTRDAGLKRLLNINGNRWDLIDEGAPFVPGAGPQPPGHDIYPHNLTQAEVEKYVAAHPAEKAAIYNEYTVIKRQGTKLTAVAYHAEYRAQLEPMAKALREAAALSPDAAFANFLRLRADALLTDDYYPSDLAWVDLKNPKIDVILAPYETYLDHLLGVKTSYGGAVLIRNEAESRKLELYAQFVPRIQDALPLDPADRPSKAGLATPMEVMDAPYRSGDLRYGYQAVADNLPNDPRIHEKKGTKKIFFKNFMDARVDNVIVPISKRLMAPAQAAKVSGEGYLAAVIMHEISHGLGPAYSRTKVNEKADIRAAIGPNFGGLEEAKADVTGMFALNYLAQSGAIPKENLEGYYASYVAGIFRTLRFGTAEAHGKAELMEFNYLMENKALAHAAGKYVIDYTRMPIALAALAKQLLTFEAQGDRAGVEAWFAKYGKVPAELQAALANTKDIPVDVSPVFSFPDNLR